MTKKYLRERKNYGKKMNNDCMSKLSVVLNSNIEEYRKYLLNRIRFSTTIVYVHDIRRFIKYAEEIDDLQKCLDFWTESMHSAHEKCYCHKSMCIVKNYIKWLFKHNIIATMPTFLKLKDLSRTVLTTGNQVNEKVIWQIITSPVEQNPKYAIAIMLMYGCGLRPSEALRLKWADIHIQKQIIVLKDDKSDKRRLVPIPKFVKNVLEIRVKQVDDEKLVIDMPYISLNKFLKRNNVSIDPSQFRKFYIADLIVAGVPSDLLNKIINFPKNGKINLSDSEIHQVISCHRWNNWSNNQK